MSSDGADRDLGQLTFASSAPQEGRAGGWQVRQVSAGLTPQEQASALAWVATEVAPVVPPPRFPSAEDIAALPRRLLHTVQDGARGTVSLLVHSAPAGADASGRPGNVFNHVLLDRGHRRRWDGPAPVRPVQWWRSPGWLTPYGADEVEAATFDDAAPPGPGTAVGREQVAAFLLAEPGRRAGLARLLDGVSSALETGRSVLVVADTQDEGVLWIAAVCFLASPQASDRLSFSTYERRHDLTARGCRTVLAVVLRDDPVGESDGHGDVLVVDPAQPHGWAGSDVPPSDWSRLATAVCSGGPELLVDRLLALDELSEWEPRAAAGAPWWALAVAVGEHAQLEGAWPVATRVLLRDTPEGVQLGADVHLLLEDLVARAASSTADECWALLSLVGAGEGSTARLFPRLVASYVARALAEPGGHWRAAPVVPPAARSETQAALAAVAEPALADLAVADATATDWTARALRDVGLLERCGLSLRSGDVPALAECVERLALSVLDPTVAPLLAEDTSSSRVLRRRVAEELRPFLEQTAKPPGQRLCDDARAWLASGYEPTDLPSVVTLVSDPVLADVLVHLAVEARNDAARPYRAAAATVLLDSRLWLPGDVAPSARTEAALRKVQGSADWTAAELEPLVSILGSRPELDLVPTVCRALVRAAPSRESAALARTALRTLGLRPEPADPAQTAVLTLAAALTPGWHRWPRSDWGDWTEVLAAAASCWRLGQADDATRRWVAPVLLVAGLRVLVWSAAGHREASSRRAQEVLRTAGAALEDLASGLDGYVLDDDLEEALQEALALLGEPLPGDTAFARDLYVVLAPMAAGRRPRGAGPLDAEVLLTGLTATRAVGRRAATLGDAVLRAAAGDMLPAVVASAAPRLDALGLAGSERARLDRWHRILGVEPPLPRPEQ